MLYRITQLSIFLLLITSLAGCSKSPISMNRSLYDSTVNPDENTVNLSNTQTASDQEKIQESIYPIITKNPLFSESMRGPDFEIFEPVKSGDMTVVGTGPVDVPIKLVDVTLVGELLAETTINKKGEFIFHLQIPLLAGHSIGLQIGDLTDTDFEASLFIYNENYFERPFIGILFDIVSVTN